MAEREELVIHARYTFTVYKNDSYRICRFEYIEKPADCPRRDFVAKGNDLPEIRNVTVTMQGHWETRGKDRSFVVSSFSLALPSSEEGVISYLTSLKCGIGQARAKALYKHFGENIWFIIENQPERLQEAGLERFAGQKLVARIRETQVQAKVMQMFNGTSVTYKKISNLISHFGSNTLSILQDNPYAICQVEGFSFMMADSLAMERGIDPTNIERRKAAILAALDSAAVEGHVCYPRNETNAPADRPRDNLVDKMMRLLNAKRDGMITKDMCEAAITAALADGLIVSTCGFVYAAARHYEESQIVKELFRLMDAIHPIYDEKTLDQIIAQYEQENGLSMADSQKEAVKLVMNNQVSIMCGGPGTGKSTTAKAILYCHKVLLKEQSNPVLLSPTGKAARRLAESTGYPASTINSGLKLRVKDEEDASMPDAKHRPPFIDGNLILVDESSMADQSITFELVRRVNTGAKLVFIGDPNQLPSVGCGNVLFELIRSTVIPKVQLSVIFRQAGENPIVANSGRVLQGDVGLNLSTSQFSLMDLSDPDKIFYRACNMYLQSVAKYGIESTILLCPYRKSTSLNVNRFNIELQKILNPKKPGAPVISGKSIFISDKKSVPIEFRVGDKVMMTVNTPDANNGDTGFIRAIVKEADPTTKGAYQAVAKIAFNGDEEHLVSFDADKIRDLDLAYCSSVHKSQGEEYRNVILVMSSVHDRMLKRNLFYTAVTRAKQNVLLVGERTAVNAAILDNNIDKRYTLLADRIFCAQKARAVA